MMGICSEKHTVRWLHHYATILGYTYINAAGTGQPLNVAFDAVKGNSKHEMYEAPVGVVAYCFTVNVFYK